MTDDVEQKTDELYKKYYDRKGKDRNDLLRNPKVLFQTLAFDRSIISSFASINPNSQTEKILDVGCGDGASTINLLKLGFSPSHIYGIDILEDRIAQAKIKFPNMNWIYGDASCMEFEDNFFDGVMESTIFLQMTDDELSGK